MEEKERRGEERGMGVLLALISCVRQPPSDPVDEEVSDGHKTPFPGNRDWPQINLDTRGDGRLCSFLSSFQCKCPVNFPSVCVGVSPQPVLY